jgi:hypothetical protein
MRITRCSTALLALFLGGLTNLASAAGPRLLLLDIGRFPNNRPGSLHHQLVLLDTESGQIAATAALGTNTNLALSPQADIVAAISDALDPAGGHLSTRLTVYRAKDLSVLANGRFPEAAPRRLYQLGAALDGLLAPDRRTLLLCGLEGRGNVDLATTVLKTVAPKGDNLASFEVAERAVHIPRCRGVDFVSAANWPQVHVLNQSVILLEGVDFSSGQILSRLSLGDNPAGNGIEPASLERADFRVILRLRNQGRVLAGGGRHAYYVPQAISQHPSLPRPLPEPGFLKKIDLLANPPRVLGTSAQRQPSLNAAIAVASEAAGRLFVLEDKWNERFTHEPARTVKVYRTTDLTLDRQIELPVADCQHLEVSRDGKYLYALDVEAAKLAVLDAKSGRAIRVLKTPCTYPMLLLALPA